jgi:Dolichyl-phosphate-mannose-protein mannosyltransferase
MTTPMISRISQQVFSNWWGPAACLALASILAAITRLGWLGLVEFQGDESWALTVAEGIARGQAFPAIGIGSSLGIPNAPLFVYLMAIPETISRDPSVATGLVGLLGVGAVLATYGLGAELFDPAAGAVAALLFAVSPWGVIYSRKIWEQDTLPLFVTLGFWALFASLRSRRCWAIGAGVFLLGLATQLHPTAWYLAAPALVIVARRLSQDPADFWSAVRWLTLGISGAFLAELPFLVWQGRNGWPTIQAAGRVLGGPAQADLDAVRLAASVAVGNGYPSLANVANVWRAAGYVEAVLFLAGLALLGRCAYRAKGASHRTIALAITTWLVAPVLLQLRHSVLLYPHYFIILYPAPFLVMGLAISAGWQWSRQRRWSMLQARLVRAAIVAAVGLPVALGILAFGTFVATVEQGSVPSASGVPLNRQKLLFATLEGLAAGDPIYFGSHDSLAPTMIYLSADRWHVFNDLAGLRLGVTAGSAVLAISDPTSPGGNLAARWFGDGKLATLSLTDWQTVTVFRVGPNGSELAPDFRSDEVAFDDGLVLVGHRVASDPAQRQVRIDLHWRVDRLPATPPTVFTHVLDATRQIVTQKDGLANAPADWRVGDVIVDEFGLPWPKVPGPYQLEIGLYDYPSLKRVALSSPAPGTATDSLDLGPVSLAPLALP